MSEFPWLAFKPKFTDVALALSYRVGREWEKMAATSWFSVDYMDHEGVPDTVVFDRDVFHAAEQLWADGHG